MRARQAMPPWAPTPITVACLRDPLCEDHQQEGTCPGRGVCWVCHGHGCGGGLSVGRQPLLVPLARVWQGHGMSCVGYGEGVWLECCFPFPPDGQWIVSGASASDMTVRIWQVLDGVYGAGCLRRPPAENTHPSAPSMAGDRLAAAGSPSPLPALSRVPNVCITACWQHPTSLPPPARPIWYCSSLVRHVVK